jgi:nucleoid-associated protein YgaU
VWLAAVAVAWYLALVTALGLTARVFRAAQAVDVLDRLTVPLVRRLLGTWMALGTVALPAASAWASPAASGPVVMVMDSAPANAPLIMVLEAPAPVPPPAAPTAAPAAVGSDDEHVVRPGEHFWSIAEAHLAATTGRAPSSREVSRYWQRLVSANTAQLRVQSNPDLLYPGQTLRLPKPQ